MIRGQAALIRPAVADDVPAIARVRTASWQTTYRGIVPQAFLDEVHPDDGFVQRLAGQVGDAESGVEAIVAELGGEVVGYAIFGPDRVRVAGVDPAAAPTSSNRSGRGEVYAIYLLEGMRRRGIGRDLLSAAARRLARIGYRDAVLWMIESNEPARRFYDRMGWRATGSRRVHHLGADVPEIQFERHLTS